MRKQKQTVVKTADIKEVVKFAKGLISQGQKPKDVLNEVKKLYFVPYGIRVLYDKSEDVNIIHQTDEDGVNPSDNAPINIEPTKSKRIILVCDRASRNHEIELASECNGIVIDMLTWNILSYPPAALSFNMSADNVKKNLSAGLYKIYKADFGTIVTFYYYNNRWILSTANSYEIDNKIWSGNRPFRDIINEIFNSYKINMDELDKDWCYSFGFHHNEYHPFNGGGQKPARAWFVRSVNLKKFNDVGEFVLSHDNMNKLPLQLEAADLNKNCNENPVEVYSKMIKDCDGSLINYHNNNQLTPCYGFILISARPDIIANVLIESKLLMKIRKLICRKPPPDIPVNKRFIWWMVNATFNEAEKPVYRSLFPYTKTYGEKLDTTIREIATKVVDVSQKDNYKFSETQTDKIAKYTIEKMKEKKIIVNRKPISIGIIQDFLMTPEFTNLYTTIL
jgi:hypothetical protein